MTEHFYIAFSASALAAMVTTLGIFVIRNYEQWGRRNSTYFICFAAGVLISVSFLHIVPISVEMNRSAPIYLLAGYFSMHFLNRFITAYVCDRPTTADYAIGLVPMIGIGIHSFIDGIIYSITFTVSIFTGALAAIGMVLHEFPEGIVTYVLLIKGGMSKKSAFWLAFIAAALTTPLGMITSYPFIAEINRHMLGALLASSAGALIYGGATHLLPAAEKESRRHSLIALGTGILVAIGIVLSQQ